MKFGFNIFRPGRRPGVCKPGKFGFGRIGKPFQRIRRHGRPGIGQCLAYGKRPHVQHHRHFGCFC